MYRGMRFSGQIIGEDRIFFFLISVIDCSDLLNHCSFVRGEHENPIDFIQLFTTLASFI